MPRRSDAPTDSEPTHAPLSQHRFAEHLLGRLHELNQRSIELLVHAARSAEPPYFELITLLGMVRPVAEIVSTLRFTEIDRIAERQFRHVRPRWEDRPAAWRKLLEAAHANDVNAMREFNLLGLQAPRRRVDGAGAVSGAAIVTARATLTFRTFALGVHRGASSGLTHPSKSSSPRPPPHQLRSAR